MPSVIGARVDAISYADATATALRWARAGDSRYICVANVHVLMEAHDVSDFQEVINNADMVTPDGMPLVWILRRKGYKLQERVYGPTLMVRVIEAAALSNIPVGFYGGTPEVLDALKKRLAVHNPSLNIVYGFSPPFRELTFEEDKEIIRKISYSGARIIFVGLGCPKQERWMAVHRGKISAVMIGVGAGFDFVAGAKRQAPRWMQKVGLEWLFRFTQEPRRLWRRYLFYNPRFALLAILELLGWWSP